jgi:hypothetical protein
MEGLFSLVLQGTNGIWVGGREKTTAALCRKVIETKDNGINKIEKWGMATKLVLFKILMIVLIWD